jgi:hypothetical protein
MLSNRIRGLAVGLSIACASSASAFVTFESGPVRPLAKSPDGNRLFVCNIPDNRLEIFDITASGLVHLVSVPVGLEPVAVAARTNTEGWVVNHLSDSISVACRGFPCERERDRVQIFRTERQHRNYQGIDQGIEDPGAVPRFDPNRCCMDAAGGG